MTNPLLNEFLRVVYANSAHDARGHTPSAESLELARASGEPDFGSVHLTGAFTSAEWDARALACVLGALQAGSVAGGMSGLAALREFLDEDDDRLARVVAMNLIFMTTVFAMGELAVWGDRTLTEDLLVRVDDASPTVRQWAAFGLGAVGSRDDRIPAALHRMLDSDPVGGPVCGALIGVAFREEDVTALALELQRADPDWQVRLYAGWLLAFLEDPTSYGLRDVNDRVVASAMASSGASTDPRLVAEVTRILRDSAAKPHSRFAAAVNLLNKEGEYAQEGIRALQGFLQLAEFEEQYEAIRYLLGLAAPNDSGGSA